MKLMYDLPEQDERAFLAAVGEGEKRMYCLPYNIEVDRFVSGWMVFTDQYIYKILDGELKEKFKMSELSDFSTENLYGCINNGGNNVFLNCGFNSNITGFVIDNADGKANNQAHGSAIGCTFNHSDGNTGVGIAVFGAKWGYVFSGCQLHYSKVIVKNSTNITFSNFNVGREHSFEINGGNLTTLTNCSFLVDANIKITNNDNVKIINCYTTDGKEITK